ncbi:MAG: DUF63 family protein [Thermoplasmata archaeon]|nr:MAG: DUF63 family protein [Thermoplasmata archaeon]
MKARTDSKEPDKNQTGGLRAYVNANPGKVVLFALIAILGIFALGALILPDLVWDQFIWRYFWGPIAADAEDRTIGGINEGYNAVSTISYGLILAAAIFLIYRLIVILQINLDKWFFLAIIPFIMFGGLARALEDAKLFNSPVVYLFISPLIYILTGLIAVALMVIAHKLTFQCSSKDKPCEGKTCPVSRLDYKLIAYIAICFIVINLALAYIFLQSHWTNYRISLVYPAVISVAAYLSIVGYSRYISKGVIPMALVFGALGLVMLSYPLSGVIGWFESPQEWQQIFLASEAEDSVVFRPVVVLQVIGLSLAATAVWALAAFAIYKKTKWHQAALFFSGTNLALVFGQFTDAAATFIAIDYYSYWEKHVVPGFLIDVFDTAAVMFLLKVFALLFAIYLLDIGLREELKKHSQIIPLVKIAVLVLGLAPGTRDMLRLAMGV